MADSKVCHICGSIVTSTPFSVKDYSITQENFSLIKCSSCNYLFTSPAPNPEAIKKYYASDAYISHTDGKNGLIEKLYHLVRKLTLAGKRQLISSFTNNKKGVLLDYGCGTGAFLGEMKSHGWDTFGIEPDDGARLKAEKSIGAKIGIPSDVESLPDNFFDIVSMWHVLEHVHDIHSTVEHLKRILKKDGKLFIAVPNHASYDAKYYKSYWAAYDVPRHLHHFSANAIKRLMEKHGLRITAIKGMWFDSFYVSMLSEKYKTGKINYFKAFITGFYSNLVAIPKVEKCSSLIYVISR